MSVDSKAEALYGAPLERANGVLHVVAVAREGGSLRVMKIGPAPSSATDYFALELTRARVDTVLLSGSILRAEPELRYTLSSEVAEWRGRPGPTPVILTRGSIPVAHPVFEQPAVIFTAQKAAWTLREELPNHVEVVGVDDPSPRAALRFLRDRGASVSIEAGPRVSVPLHGRDSPIDELLLSVFEGELPDEARGGEFLSERALAAELRRVAAPTVVEEPSGRWSFSRWLRR